MPTLTAAQVAGLVKRVGFPEGDHATMVAVCKAESGFRVEAKNPRSSASGLFQILWSVHRQYDQRRLLSDAEYNTRAAYDIYRKQGKRAWVAYTSGAYQKFMAEARQGVAQASSATGNPSLPGGAAGDGGQQQTGITYGPLGPELTRAGTGHPMAAAEEVSAPLAGIRVLGAELGGDYSSVVVGAPTFEAGIETIPNLKLNIIDPEGDMLWNQRSIWRQGTRVQYRDLNMMIDEYSFEGGSAGTGELAITAVDDIVFRLMSLRGPRTASNISATQWIAEELAAVGVDPARYFLGEAVPTQSEIARDVPDQGGAAQGGEAASAWSTIVRLAKELGKRVFVSGDRLVFGSSAFAMRWTAPDKLRLSWHALDWGERFITMPSAKFTSIGDRSNVIELTGRIPLNRAKFFRPGVPVIVRNVPYVAAGDWVDFMVAKVAHSLGTDADGADITLLQPVDPPPEPPQQQTAAGANGGPTASGGYSSGSDSQVDRIVALALQQAGKRYVFGGEASPSDPNPRAFDCSELVEWTCARNGVQPRMPDGSSAQRAHCARHGTMITVQAGINTKGALLFMPGHVAISLGGGKTIEAMNPSRGVTQGNANGRGWTGAARIPGAKGYR